MGGGILELKHIGNEEAYFLYNPQITFFKSVYRRFTNFALESIRVEFENSCIIQPDAEKKITAKIPRHGDLIKHISLRVELPALRSTSEYAVQWAPNVGCILINMIDFMIESQIIEQITGEWLHIFHEIYSSDEERQSFKRMVNHPREPISDTILDGNDLYTIPKRTMIIPIPFWFSRSSGNNLPIVALTKNFVHLQITFNPLQDLFIVKNKQNPNGWVSPRSENVSLRDFAVDESHFTSLGTLDLNGELSIMYVFVEDVERNRIVNQNLVYTLTNVQYVSANELVRNSYEIPLNVKHPMKEIIWVLQRDDVKDRNDWFNYTNFKDENQTEVENIMSNENPLLITDSNTKHILQSASIKMNKAIRLELKENAYFSEFQPHVFLKKQIKTGLYMYNFGLHPTNEEQPSGTCNASAFNSIDLVCNIINASQSHFNARIFVVAYNQLRILGGFGGLQFSK